ncbi:hypothetical protein [Krasilnikovia sp. MM14-A1004]|uniref:hypothetical protein n=1 Tax=Krasilnikovia sp. MM14-A1004 TaxID=3373541 RepID=UPI00399C557B
MTNVAVTVPVAGVALGLAVMSNIWLAPRVLDVACLATGCAPRAVALAGWATIAAVPATVGLISLVQHRIDGWLWWLTLAAAVVVAAPGVWLGLAHRDDTITWLAFGAAPGLDAYRAGVRVGVLAAAAGAMAFAACRLVELTTGPTDTVRYRASVIAGRVMIGLATVGSLIAVVVWHPE